MIKRVLLATILLGILVGGVFVAHFYRVFFASNTAFETPTKEVLIPTENIQLAAYDTISKVVKRIDLFQQAAIRKGYHPIPGRFVLDYGMNNNDMINRLRIENKPLKLTFNNQKTLMHFARFVGNKIEADSTAIMQAFLDADFLEENGFNTENVFSICIPNTYEFYWNTTAIQFRDRMMLEYKRFWTPKREAARKKIKLSRTEVVALAAIVQLESYRKVERPTVAGVYLNRLRKRMRLQADPTVIYALKRRANDFDLDIRRVLYVDLKIKSPYNTYRNRGVPPGPITMPDVSAIDAVLFAEKHPYLYFVADPDRTGYHLFATSLAEHNKNKKRYTSWLRQKNIYR
ncbi:MAG: endolytic transglycosylase MltG [Flavobacteriaceae bacterium]